MSFTFGTFAPKLVVESFFIASKCSLVSVFTKNCTCHFLFFVLLKVLGYIELMTPSGEGLCKTVNKCRAEFRNLSKNETCKHVKTF